MTYQYIEYETRGEVAYVTINRPKSLNALTPETNRELGEAFADFRDSADLKVAILTGTGDRAFCAGDDLKYVAEHGKLNEPYPGFGEHVFGGITHDFVCWKPIIGAINGYALGGGLELAMACDILIAAEHATFGLPEPKVGVVAGAGGPYRLPRQIPHKVAMGMLLTGRSISADHAYQLGLVNEVIAAEELISSAGQWAADIIEGAPLAVTASKQMALSALDAPFEVSFRSRPSEYVKAMASPDYLEGPRAFAQKRPPKWVSGPG